MARGGSIQADDNPRDLDAEQALLGVLLYANTSFSALPPALAAQHFFEPFHQRLFQRIKMRLEAGQGADPVSIAGAFSADPAFEELGGAGYLADLVDRAPPEANAGDYGRAVLDAAGRRALYRTGRGLIEQAHNGSISIPEILTEVEATVGEVHALNSTIRMIEAEEATARVLEHIEKPELTGPGLLTGLASLDEALGPWMADDLIVLGARPGMGKSAEAAIISRNVALSGLGAIEIHGEMSVEQAWRRRLTATAYEIFATGTPAYSDIRRRRVTFDQLQMLERAREQLRGIPLAAVKRTGLTLGRMRAMILHQRAQWERLGIPLGLVVIDHVGLLRTDRDHSSRVEQQTEISNGLKELADHLKVPILALAQLNRAVESRDDKRPTLSDLRDSGSWEQDADVVIGAYREAYYAQNEREPDANAKGGLAWNDWSQRRASPWIENILLKVREGTRGAPKLWAHMPTNTILGEPPRDDFGGFI